MRYVRITSENVDALLIDGAIVAHCGTFAQENELDEIVEDRVIDIEKRVNDTEVAIIAPDATGTIKYELNYFTNGHWWLKDFSKERHQEDDGFKYIMLFFSVLLLSLAAYMFVYKINFSGFYGPGRLGGSVSKGTVSAPFVLLLGLAFLGFFFVSPHAKRK